MATVSVKLAGPFNITSFHKLKLNPFYRVISTRNTLLVRPGEYYTEDAVKAGILSRTKDRINPFEVNFVMPKDDNPHLRNLDQSHIHLRVGGTDEADAVRA